MQLKKTSFFLFLLCGIFSVHGQQTTQTSAQEKPGKTAADAFVGNEVPFKQVLNDSVFFNLMRYGYASKIDSLWQQRMMGSNLYEEMQEVVQNAPYQKKVYRDLSTKVLKKRLAKIDATTPLKVIYNPAVENVIHRYLRWNKKDVEQLMSLAAYYFPMFEAHLAKYNVPLEIKYLAIVESTLNPRAQSWAGATGLWQFMFPTGKMFGLGVSSYVDERMDPILATEAACKYLSNLYDMFGDWNLALASYNAGPGNVSQAIRRSGGNKNYWEIRPYLPNETAGYVPAFFASMYLFEYGDEHGFQPKIPEIAFFQTDTIRVKEMLTFKHISEVLDIDVKLLQFLNPSYKLNIIPYIEDENYYVRLPINEAGLFTANEKAIYGYVEEEIAARTAPLPRYVEADDKISYRVQSGDYLGKIAAKFGVGISQIKDWNNMSGSLLQIGEQLTIYPRKPAAAVFTPTTSTETTATTSDSAPTKEIYIVQKGDSLWAISQKFSGISVENIQDWNGISGTTLKPGMKLKLSKE